MTPVAATLDGENGFGFVIGLRAMEEAIAMAREYGIGVVSVKRSTHFGMAASYALPAVEAGMMAMVFSNASPAMPPWGGKSMLLGTNPFCMAAPAGKHRPIILDMSPAVAARGKIRRAERRGETIPLGYALDADGKPTTDPKAALAGGVVLPIGGHKGSGLSMFMDIFGGVISGANFGGDVGDQYKALRPRAGRRPFLPGDAAQPVRQRGRIPRPHRHADRARARGAARRRLRRGPAARRAGGPHRGGAPQARHSLRGERSRRLAGRSEEGRRAAAGGVGPADPLEDTA